MALKEGDVVEVHYTIKVLEDGEEKLYETTKAEVAKQYNALDPNKRYAPLFVIVGRTKLLDPLDKVLREMNPGEKRELVLKPEEAFGPWRKDLVVTVPVKALRRAGIRPRVGEEIEAQGQKGRIIKVTERFAYVDFNHPLAGKTLKVEIEVVRKLETDEEKVKAIVLRYLPLREEAVNVRIEDGKAVVELPGSVIGLRDLDSLLQSILINVYDLTNLKELVIQIRIPMKREEEKEEAEEVEKEEETKEEVSEEHEESKEEASASQ